MDITHFALNLFYVFLFTLVFIFTARVIAIKNGLVDKPNFRKKHIGVIPIIGGISLFFGICFAFFITDEQIPHKFSYIFCSGLLVFVGVLDDKFDISVKFRAGIQAFIAIIMMTTANLKIESFGYVFSTLNLIFGPFDYIITLFAVWATINAFNMIDGIDGLLGSLSLVFFVSLGFLQYRNCNYAIAFWCFAFIVAIIPYIFLNLGGLGLRFKIFMGDAGSTLIGFTIIWILISSTQGKYHAINPVTGLWLIAIPLIDMIAIMYRRIRKGMSPFSPDRQHIHHLIMRSGFSAKGTFILITLLGILLACIGIIGEFLIFEWVMLWFFLFLFMMYGYLIKRVWKVSRFIKRLKRRIR
ncbi:Undecaprenyl-phosphate alpha-N-acetylglucosaminyl 1-phosphate transferase [Candidatus Providencia siddallii]|uniref:Undecaprenyl-phosphate alpha-N-acetylglucosaminyl 1-phosphate transferase n=1 Tax=Candidatus Providencia siddallii TaxID=1715285 RepID=A0A0M6W9S5_9GAMM|nr:Undecaprenyl-phosphate alpha-N-acetylglucosaminyl 1-phosphate transferase [Candidatus Providencia siddallii]